MSHTTILGNRFIMHNIFDVSAILKCNFSVPKTYLYYVQLTRA